MADFSDLKSRLQTVETDREKLETLADYMSMTFALPTTDVTILMEKNGVLIFHHPCALLRCTVPITRKSVAGMTYESNKIYVYNNLTDVEHVELFEKLVQTKDGSMPIQRIISCPIPGIEGPRGVLQLCRKGNSRDDTMPFERGDVDNLAGIAKTVGRILQLP